MKKKKKFLILHLYLLRFFFVKELKKKIFKNLVDLHSPGRVNAVIIISDSTERRADDKTFCYVII